MSESARERPLALDAAQAVKAYIRLNRETLAADGELLAQLLPERFPGEDVGDLQRFVIDRLKAENAKLRSERDALVQAHSTTIRLHQGVKDAVLDLLDARSFAEAIAVAIGAAPSLGADRASICVENEMGAARTSTEGVRLIPAGTIASVLGRDGMGAFLSSGGELLLGAGGGRCRSIAAFRLRIGRESPASLYVLGAHDQARFEGEEAEASLRYFARALERAIRAWLDLPRI